VCSCGVVVLKCVLVVVLSCSCGGVADMCSCCGVMLTCVLVVVLC